ncbi:MAG: VacJ family lipoprotein [Candidatus Rokubacteria bacterium]|nr:VacJ family lipoprotein [Candidatus Rokubacteria bacterium]
MALALTGCGSVSHALRGIDTSPAAVASPLVTAPLPAPPPAAEALAAAQTVVLREPFDWSAPEPFVVGDVAGAAVSATRAEPAAIDGGADAAPTPAASAALQEPAEAEQYDPWESFHERMFGFNRGLDRYLLKPAARAYKTVMPEQLQVVVANGFDNIRWVPRFINSMLQGKFSGAGREVSRFLINSTVGFGGLFDPAKDYWGIRKSAEDFGQTLGVWGAGPGPYLVLPFLEPTTVRDGIGMAVDGVMDPLAWVLPFFWDRLVMKVGDTVNDRALNYDLFQGVEETTLDLYSSVRHFYLNRRERLIRE